MSFIAIVGLSSFLCPPSINVFLTFLARMILPELASFALLDHFVFLSGIALFSSDDKTGVNHFAFLTDHPLVLQTLVECCKTFSVEPNCISVGNILWLNSAKKTLKTGAIKDLELRLSIIQSIEALEEQHLKHKYRVLGRTLGTTAFALFVFSLLKRNICEKALLSARKLIKCSHMDSFGG